MVISGVKRKFPVAIGLASFAVLTSLLSWASIVPASWVESAYSRRLFPTISYIAGRFADSVPFSWVDLWIATVVVSIAISLWRRSWRLPLGLFSACYLIFFWGWGLNYHRASIETRLGLNDVPATTSAEFDQFATDMAASLNRLWPVVAEQDPNPQNSKTMANETSNRVRRVIARMDGKNWRAASRIKHSYLADWWLRAAGIEGVFNPFAHEPILASGIPDFELPFLMAHELAHVQGIADEGDANFVAFLSTVESDDPLFQYSAAFEMWLHLGRSAKLLDSGPRRDLQTHWDRALSQEVRQVTRLQSTILDSHLKANGVHDGVQSYSHFVALAIATRSHWSDFR
jgi:hypothetical protein